MHIMNWMNWLVWSFWGLLRGILLPWLIAKAGCPSYLWSVLNKWIGLKGLLAAPGKLGALRSPRKMNIYILVASNGFQIRHVWIPRRVLQWQQCLAFPMATGATNILGNSAMATAVEAGRQWLVPKMLRALRSHHVSRGCTMALGVDL